LKERKVFKRIPARVVGRKSIVYILVQVLK